MRRSWILATVVFLIAAAAFAEDPFVAETKAWQAKRIERLKGEYGWLTLVGLYWLEPGENAFGSADSNPIRLPEGHAPAKAGVFVLENGKVRLKAAPGAGLKIDGKPVVEAELRPDTDENADTLELGNLRIMVVERGEKLGIRVRDPESPVRKNFQGIDTYAPDAKYKVTATWKAFDKPREVDIPTVLGTVEKGEAPGIASFTIDGVECTLEPTQEGDSLFFVFKDTTAGKETYPAGRFLYTPLPKDGKLVIDFNRAYNPPCAFTPYATCPLPSRENVLKVPIRAGEKKWVGHEG